MKLSTARNFFKMAGNVYFFTKMTDETAHRNGNARFTIFTKDDEIEIKWLKSKFLLFV